MKKVVIVIIIALFFGSVVLINLFGLNYAPAETTTFATSIEVKEVRQMGGEIRAERNEKRSEKGWIVFRITFIEGKEEYTKDPESLNSNPNTYYIDCEVLPANARNKNIRFVCPENDYYVFNPDKRTITFLAKNVAAQIDIIAVDDAKGARDSVYLSVR